jgi:type II secretion system protein G
MITLSRARPGFSIAELLIVIAIGAILMAGVIRGFRYIKSARISTTENALRTLRSSIEIFQAKVGEFPSSLDDLFTRPSNPALAKRWSAGAYGIEDERDLKDAWGNRIQYERRPKGNPPYELYSWGPDGEGSPEDKWIRA